MDILPLFVCFLLLFFQLALHFFDKVVSFGAASFSTLTASKSARHPSHLSATELSVDKDSPSIDTSSVSFSDRIVGVSLSREGNKGIASRFAFQVGDQSNVVDLSENLKFFANAFFSCSVSKSAYKYCLVGIGISDIFVFEGLP